MKKLCLILIGFIPLIFGFILNALYMTFSDSVIPLQLISILFILFWCLIGFITFRFKESLITSVCTVNLASFIALALNLFQEIVLGRYWDNIVGTCTQYFFFPVLNLSFTLSAWSNRVWAAYLVGFILMCSAYFAGYKISEKINK